MRFPGALNLAPGWIGSGRHAPRPTLKFCIEASVPGKPHLGDRSQGLVDMLDLGVVVEIEQSIDLRPVSAEAAPEFGFADAGCAHGLIEPDLGNGQRRQARRFASAQR